MKLRGELLVGEDRPLKRPQAQKQDRRQKRFQSQTASDNRGRAPVGKCGDKADQGRVKAAVGQDEHHVQNGNEYRNVPPVRGREDFCHQDGAEKTQDP